jgi:hypothetical protein
MASMDEEVVYEHREPDRRVLGLEPMEGGQCKDLYQIIGEATACSYPSGGKVGVLGDAVERNHSLAGVLVQSDGEERHAEAMSSAVVPKCGSRDMLVIVTEVPHETGRGLGLGVVGARLRSMAWRNTISSSERPLWCPSEGCLWALSHCFARGARHLAQTL